MFITVYKAQFVALIKVSKTVGEHCIETIFFEIIELIFTKAEFLPAAYQIVLTLSKYK